MSTAYIGPIQQLLQQNFPQPSGLWNLSSDNQLDASWLYATPTSVWSLPYPQFKQAVAGPGPLELQTCTTANGATERCQPMDASMTAPGQTASKLLIGHSDDIVDAIYDVMISARVLLDVTTLTPPTGRFLDAFKNALRYLSNQPAGQRPIVRILFSNPWPNIAPEQTAEPFLRDITRHLDPAARMRIYVYVMSSSFNSWNHAKIIAADGARAVVGGHNMWGPPYLGVNPVHDVSMRVTGSAALHAQNFADTMWRFGQYRQDHLNVWVPGSLDEQLDLVAAYVPVSESAPSGIVATVLPDRTMYETATAAFPASSSTGTIPILSVGRAASTQSNYLLPTVANWFFPFDEPGDQAIVKLVSLAKTSVRMSLQSFQLAFGVIAGWNPALFRAMADALNRGVNISVVLSNFGAIAGGLNVLEAPYGGDLPAIVNAKMVWTMIEWLGLSWSAAERIVSQRFQLAGFRYSSDATYPGNVAIGNHAKTLIVDDTAFYLGSQNLYSSNLNEFGYIVEDAATAQSYLASYWTPLWNWSKRTTVTDADPDGATSQQVEAMRFIRALQLDALLDIKWAQLVNQREQQSGDAAKLAIQGTMDELIASAGFDTTAATVLAGQRQPFFTEHPPSSDATPSAIAFVANLMTDPALMRDFSRAVYAQGGSVADGNAAINTFLTGRGYTCTALQVMAAFAALRTVNLAYWSGTYTTWLTADAGASYANESSPPDPARPAARTPTPAGATPPAPALGPLLVIAADSVSYGGVAIKAYAYDGNLLSWTTSGGNASSASLRLGTVTRATMNDAFTGNECFGTITDPPGSGSVSTVYSLYGRASGDSASSTLAYVIGALIAAGMLAALGLFAFKSMRRQSEWMERAQEKLLADEGGDVPLEPLSSPNRVQEGAFLKKRLRQDQIEAAEQSIGDLLPFEPGMTPAQRLSLNEAATNLHAARTTLRETTARTLPDDVRNASATMDGVVPRIQSLNLSVSEWLSTAQRLSFEENSGLTATIGSACDDIAQQEAEDEPFEVEDF